MAYQPTYENAKRLAEANAAYFGVPFVVFCDTSMNHQVERMSEFHSRLDCVEVFRPIPPIGACVYLLNHKGRIIQHCSLEAAQAALIRSSKKHRQNDNDGDAYWENGRIVVYSLGNWYSYLPGEMSFDCESGLAQEPSDYLSNIEPESQA